MDRVIHVVRDHESGEALLGNQARGQIHHARGGLGIEGGKVLVEQEQPRTRNRRHQQRQRLTLAAGQRTYPDRQSAIPGRARAGQEFAGTAPFPLR